MGVFDIARQLGAALYQAIQDKVIHQRRCR
jgi:hypothetical protein